MKHLLTFFFIILSFSAFPQATWTYAGGNGSAGTEVSRAICTDAAGNIYVTGNFSNTVDLDYGAGTASATSAGSNDAFIASYTAAGAYRWSITAGNTSSETGIAIITNGTDVYATGQYSVSATFGSTTLTSSGAGDIYLVKLNASTGAVTWAVSYGALSGDSPLGLCFDASNNVYMSGTYTNPWSGSCTTPTTQGSADIFIQKINPSNGSCIWASTGGSSSGDGAESGICYVPASNKIVLATSYSGASATFGSFTLNNVNSSTVQRDIAILELNASTGAFTNAITIGTSTNDDVSSGVYDQNTGNVFVSGSYQSTLTLPNGASGISLTSTGGNDIWVGSYSPSSHAFVWAKSAGGSGGTATDEKAYAITSDGTGTIAISGSHFSTPTNFGSLSLSNSSGFGQIFIAGYNALNGNELWVNNATTASPALQSIGRGITTNNNSGTFWVTGTFCTTTTFGSQSGITSAGFADLFNAKFTAPTAPTVTTTAASGVDATSATIGGNVTGNGGGSVTERGIVWATTTNPTIDNTKVTNGSGNGIFSGTVSSLPSNTLIYYRAYATNLGGTAYGSELSFTTTSAGSPEINIQGNSVSISDGNLTPSTLDHTSFGSQSVCSGTIIRTFTIQNTGTSNLTFSNPTISGSNASDFSVSSNPTSPVSASGSTTFQITFNPSAAGPRSATVSLANNDSDEATYDFAVEGSGSDVSLTALSQTNVSCNGGSNGAASINTPTGGAGGYTYNWTPGNPTGDGTVSVTGLTAGTWTCTVTDANACTATQTFTITQPAGMTVTPSSQTNVSCFGGSNGAASINTPTGGAGGYIYNWTPGNPTGDGTVSVTGLSAGTWTCTVTDANACTATQTFTITQPAGMTVTPASQTNVSCFGGSNGAASINTPTGGAGGYTYNWTPGNPTGDGTVSVTGLSAGTWTCTVTDANACTATQTFTITQPAEITVTPASQTNVACNGGTNGAASINTPTGGAGGYTYNWTPGNPTGDGTVSVTGLTAGTWTCTVTDANSCTATQTFTITQPVGMTVTPSSQTNVSCFGGSNGAASINTPTGGAGGYTYNWTPGNPTGDGTVSVTGLSAGTWTCTVTDANSCTATQTFTITQPSGMTVTPASQTNVSCFGGSNGAASINTPTGGAGGYTYNWTPGNPTGDGTVSVSGLSAGTWTCTVTDANACTATQTFTITQPAGMTVTPASQTNVSCFGGSNGAASINTPTGGAGGYTYNWTPGNPTGDGTVSVTGLSAGTWTCTVTDANACTATQTFTITQPTAITLSALSQTNVSCFGGSNGAASINTPTGGAGGYTYNWSPGNPTGDGTASVTGLAAGAYTCTVTDANACTATQTFTITQPTAITLSALSQTNVSCFGGSNGAASINTPTGGAGGYIYNWTPGNPTGDGTVSVTGLSAGTWTCTVTDANACTATQTFTITQPAGMTVTPASQTNVSCFGGSNGAASINTPTGGAGGYTYNWTLGNPTGDGTVSVTGLSAGTWTCTVTDANACTATQTFTITQPTAITLSALSQTNVSCFGGSNGAASINTPTGGAGGYTYNWSPGNPTGDGTASVTGLAAGAYTCTVTDANACTATQTFTITQPTAITLSALSQTNVSCFGGSNGAASINTPTGGAGGYTYNWTPGNPTGDGTVSVTGLSAGTWTCTVTDANACTATQTFTITQPTVISNATASQTNVSCNGGSNGSASVTPSGGAGGYTYSWSPSGGTASTATGLSAGTYTVTVTDANGCTATRNFTITQPTTISTATASQTNVSCNGGSNGSASVTPSGGAGGYTYSWSPSGGTASTATGLSAGTYTVTVTDANGCTATRNFTITQPTTISTATASQTNVSCNGGSNGSASVTPSGGAGGYTYAWSPNGGTASTATGLSAGTYTVSVTDANGCTATRNFTITQPTTISTATASQTNVSCNGGSNGSASVTPSGGAGGYTYSWSPSGGTSATATGLSAGTYTVTVTDANGCTATRNFTITQPTAITLSALSQTNVSCNGGSNGAASINAPTGGTAPYTYNWTPGNPTGDGTVSVTGLSAGTWTCTVTDANACTATQTFTITQPAGITLSALSQTNVTCNGGSNGAASINAPTGGTAPYTYNWTPGNPTGDGTASVTGLVAGTYTCTVTDANACTATQTFTITQPTAITLSALSQTNVSCNGGSNGAASINAPTGGTAPYTYNWTPGNPTGDGTASVTGLVAGTYTCTVTDANACTATQTFTITQPTAITLSALSQTNVSCNGGSNGAASINAPTGGTAPYTYNWTPGNPTGDGTASVTGLVAGTYTCTVTDANACTATQTFIITEPVLISISSIVPTVPTVCGGSNGSLAITTNNLPNGSYTLNFKQSGTPKSENVVVNSSAFNLTNLSNGVYSDFSILSGACQAVYSGSITIDNPPLIITASNTGPYNEGSTIHLVATGGNSYSWSGPNSYFSTLSNPTILNSKVENAGIYTVTVSNGICTATATTSVSIDCNNTQISYYLAYSGTNPEIIAPISNNLQVQYSPTRKMTIIAVTGCKTPQIESVKLQLSGTSNVHYYEDSEMPFTLHEVGQVVAGDILIPNLYTFIARGYSQDNVQGTVLIGPDIFQFWIVNTNNTINTPTNPSGSLCVDASFNISTTATGVYNPGNVFQTYLSDENGNFGNSVMIGSSSDPNNITCTLPNYLRSGNGYKLKVVSTTPIISSEISLNSFSIIGADLTLKSPNHNLLNTNQTIQAQNTIKASNKIDNSSNVIYKSGRFQIFEPGFEAQTGSVFKASIESVCPN